MRRKVRRRRCSSRRRHSLQRGSSQLCRQPRCSSRRWLVPAVGRQRRLARRCQQALLPRQRSRLPRHPPKLGSSRQGLQWALQAQARMGMAARLRLLLAAAAAGIWQALAARGSSKRAWSAHRTVLQLPSSQQLAVWHHWTLVCLLSPLCLLAVKPPQHQAAAANPPRLCQLPQQQQVQWGRALPLLPRQLQRSRQDRRNNRQLRAVAVLPPLQAASREEQQRYRQQQRRQQVHLGRHWQQQHRLGSSSSSSSRQRSSRHRQRPRPRHGSHSNSSLPSRHSHCLWLRP